MRNLHNKSPYNFEWGGNSKKKNEFNGEENGLNMKKKGF